ncbi:hypothetical protein [Nocardia nova]|uniref:hypothetical protein n=1 Tax=Nocardia nova TaxID=37330 RepID=UPI000CE9EF04|nr:hypothetical protein [Nocardia nova]PPJ17784.1 hypothetical protein C5E41_32855 [Nocardia nova]
MQENVRVGLTAGRGTPMTTRSAFFRPSLSACAAGVRQYDSPFSSANTPGVCNAAGVLAVWVTNGR